MPRSPAGLGRRASPLQSSVGSTRSGDRGVRTRSTFATAQQPRPVSAPRPRRRARRTCREPTTGSPRARETVGGGASARGLQKGGWAATTDSQSSRPTWGLRLPDDEGGGSSGQLGNDSVGAHRTAVASRRSGGTVVAVVWLEHILQGEYEVRVAPALRKAEMERRAAGSVANSGLWSTFLAPILRERPDVVEPPPSGGTAPGGPRTGDHHDPQPARGQSSPASSAEPPSRRPPLVDRRGGPRRPRVRRAGTRRPVPHGALVRARRLALGRWPPSRSCWSRWRSAASRSSSS